MKPIKVEVIKFQSNDGEVWDTELEAKHRDNIIAGVVKVCPMCSGTGKTDTVDFRSTERCGTCNGKGWLKKEEVWK